MSEVTAAHVDQSEPVAPGDTLANAGISLLTGAQAITANDPRVARIDENFAEFERLVSRAETAWRAGDAASAAAWASAAASAAVERHSGQFSSPRLERLLSEIGRASEPPSHGPLPLPSSIRNVLHIATQVFPIGGHSKGIRIWIESDPSRVHSLVLTQQRREIPADIRAAVEKSGGSVHRRLNRLPGGLMATVNALRRLARGYDLIVLHVGNADVVIPIAFAETGNYPPILNNNHADHLFWVGAAVCSVVGGMRQASIDVSQQRRGIAPERNVSLPILVAQTKREISHAQARARLGVKDDELLLVSVARRDKYRSVNGETYADIHARVLAKHPKARLVVVGAGPQPDWQPASDSVGGRIVALEPQCPKVWMQAADIYLDSYPFCSATSMMEAAGYALPCITRFVLPASARICSMDHPGLFGSLVETCSDAAYAEALSQLISSPQMRRERGDAIKKSVEGSNVPPAWCDFMEAAYSRCLSLPRPNCDQIFPAATVDKPHRGEPDVRIEEVYGRQRPTAEVVKEQMSLMSPKGRLAQWRELRAAKSLRNLEGARLLLPEWLFRIAKEGL